MEDTIDSKAKEILIALSNAIKIESSAPCLCGSGFQLGECCLSKPSDKIGFFRMPFINLLKYRDSQGGFIRTIPQGIFRQFQNSSSQRLRCLHPGCDNEPVSCHTIPENILRSNFGGHCIAAQLQDTSHQETFRRLGVGKAGALPVFCSKHDNELFSSVDALRTPHLVSSKHRFLLSFKAIAFALRKVQILLGIDFQVELFKPFLIHEKVKQSDMQHVEINISYLHGQYLRFVSLLRIFQDASNALSNGDWGWFLYFTRSIKSTNQVFFAGLANPSHDLDGSRVNTRTLPLSMACNFFTLDGDLYTLLATPKDGSSDAYSNLFDQLQRADDSVIIDVANNIMTFAAEKPLLSSDHAIGQQDLQLIARQRERATTSLRVDSDEIFKLADPSNSVRFVS